ncbi:MAG: hypothetical protein Ct9H300mP1_13490 [Planctomycetaceae bacterium]|nr:MAG: hypothetical protein Ct9H300mP1_13490 [Planctomycetaceae bacterium]
MCDAGAELKDAANGPLCPVDGVPLDALSAKCYEYHQCRGDRFTKQDGRQAGDCQSEVGTDRPANSPSSDWNRIREPPRTAASSARRKPNRT